MLVISPYLEYQNVHMYAYTLQSDLNTCISHPLRHQDISRYDKRSIRAQQSV